MWGDRARPVVGEVPNVGSFDLSAIFASLPVINESSPSMWRRDADSEVNEQTPCSV